MSNFQTWTRSGFVGAQWVLSGCQRSDEANPCSGAQRIAPVDTQQSLRERMTLAVWGTSPAVPER